VFKRVLPIEEDQNVLDTKTLENSSLRYKWRFAG
jgi:hypothetical protein